MIRILFVLLTAMILISCENREEKIQTAIASELKGVLYDFDSYEPIKTNIDSAFFSPSIDPEIKELVLALEKPILDFHKAKEDYAYATSIAAIYSGSYSSPFTQQQKNQAISKRNAAEKSIEFNRNQIKTILKELCIRIREDKPKENEYVGWFVTQRYKCKTGGGYPTFGDAVFVFNSDITECLFFMQNEEYELLCNLVKVISLIPEEELLNKIEESDLSDLI